MVKHFTGPKIQLHASIFYEGRLLSVFVLWLIRKEAKRVLCYSLRIPDTV